ncbi:MAG: ABC transporter permease [Terriglobales bacterium]
MMREIRYALRLIGRNPGLSLVAVLSLALGIGANATIFSFADALLLQQPPVAQPQRLVEVYTRDNSPQAALNGLYPLSYPDWKDFSERTQTLSGLAIYNPGTEVNARVGGGVETWSGQLVSANYFAVLGIKPVIGRWFTPPEAAAAGQGALVVLSYAAWQAKFGGERSVVGRELRLNGIPYTVVWVAPRGFAGMFAGLECDFWAPVTMAARLGSPNVLGERGNRGQFAVGRLKPGVTMAAASAEMDSIQRALSRQYPNVDDPRWGAWRCRWGWCPPRPAASCVRARRCWRW